MSQLFPKSVFASPAGVSDSRPFGLLTASMLLILFLTLSPFDFAFPAQGIVARVADSFFEDADDQMNILTNVILFLPFGFTLAGVLQRQRGFSQVLVASLLFSGVIELLQVFLPARLPSLVDVITNTSGGVLGGVAFSLWGRSLLTVLTRLSQSLRRRLSLRSLALLLMTYILAVGLLTLGLQQTARLSNWDLGMPLQLGNERTGDRPWKGNIGELYLGDRALATDEIDRLFNGAAPGDLLGPALVAAYPLQGEGPYPDSTGQTPDLRWQGGGKGDVENAGVALQSDRWLTTAIATTDLNRRIRQTSQFTLVTTASVSNFIQAGPARLVSLSQDPMLRNFTLGQEGLDLIFRLRTPLTGPNGTYPQLLVPNAFTDIQPHRLVLTYNGAILHLYIDGLHRHASLELTPEIGLSRYLLPPEQYRTRLSASSTLFYKGIFYGLVFVPLGLMVAAIAAVVKGQRLFYGLLGMGGIFLPALGLEWLLSVSRAFKPEAVLLSCAIAVGTLLLAQPGLTTWLQSAPQTGHFRVPS